MQDQHHDAMAHAQRGLRQHLFGHSRRKTPPTYYEVEAFEYGFQAGVAYALSDGLLRRVIALCHPDRHGDSKQSTEVTTLLNNLREELRWDREWIEGDAP